MKLIKYAVFAAVVVFITLLFQGKFHNFIFRNKGYAKNLEVHSYIITKEQLDDYFCNKVRPNQLITSELSFKNIFLLIEVKNTGSMGAWGTLGCYILDASKPMLIPVRHPTREKAVDAYSVYVIDLGTLLCSLDDETIPVTCKWQNLFAK